MRKTIKGKIEELYFYNKPLTEKKIKSLTATAVKELQFANLQVHYLLSVLHELETFTGTLEKAVIKNAVERHTIDKLIHAKKLFN